jgi:hypothetical protein
MQPFDLQPLSRKKKARCRDVPITKSCSSQSPRSMCRLLFLVAASSSLCVGWVVPHATIRQPIRAQTTRRIAIIELKKAPDEAPEERPEVNINANSIVEFNDPKHGNGAAPPILGIVQGVSDLAVQPFDPDAASAPSPLVPCSHAFMCGKRLLRLFLFLLCRWSTRPRAERGSR